MATHTAVVLARGTRPISRRPRALAEWLSHHRETTCKTVTVRRIGAGRSNIVSAVSDNEGLRWVLRERRPGVLRDFTREVTVLRALWRQNFPVARPVGHRDLSTGVPFVITSWIHGTVIHTECDAQRLTAPERLNLGFQVARTLANLHQIPPAAVGLLPPRTGHIDRQLAGLSDVWTWAGTGSVHDSSWRAIRARLVERRPQRRTRLTLVHGDFRLANLVLAEDAIRAIVDWDWCTIGDPIADLAWLLMDWRSPRELASCLPNPTRAGGFPTRGEMVEAYRQATGCSLDDLPYHRAMAHWRAATLLQAEATRQTAHVLDEETPALDVDDVDDTIADLFSGAASFLRAAK